MLPNLDFPTEVDQFIGQRNFLLNVPHVQSFPRICKFSSIIRGAGMLDAKPRLAVASWDLSDWPIPWLEHVVKGWTSMWLWLKSNQEGLRRIWSMFPLTRVPFWYRVLEPQPCLGHLVFPEWTIASHILGSSGYGAASSEWPAKHLNSRVNRVCLLTSGNKDNLFAARFRYWFVMGMLAKYWRGRLQLKRASFTLESNSRLYCFTLLT